MIEMWYDGACEPVNPGGHASYGVLIRLGKDVLFNASGYVGYGPKMSNNVAEYSGIVAGLEWFIQNNFNDRGATVRGDNMMSIQQMKGEWKARKGLYLPLYYKARALLDSFNWLYFEWIPREKNNEADELSKAALRVRHVKFRIQPE